MSNKISMLRPKLIPQIKIRDNIVANSDTIILRSTMDLYSLHGVEVQSPILVSSNQKWDVKPLSKKIMIMMLNKFNQLNNISLLLNQLHRKIIKWEIVNLRGRSPKSAMNPLGLILQGTKFRIDLLQLERFYKNLQFH